MTDPTTNKETAVTANQIEFVLPGKVYAVLTGGEALPGFTPKLTKTQSAILDRAEVVSRSKGFAARLVVTVKQADTLIDLLTASIAAIRECRPKDHNHTNTMTYMAKATDRITAAVDETMPIL